MAIKTKDPFIWNQFRMVTNQVNWEINSAKKAYYENAFNNCFGDQRKAWKTINELTSGKSNKTVINEMEYSYGQGCMKKNLDKISTSCSI